MRPSYSPIGRGAGRSAIESSRTRSTGVGSVVAVVRGSKGPPGPAGPAGTSGSGGNLDGGVPDTDFSTIPDADGGVT